MLKILKKATKPMIVAANDSIALKGKYLMQKGKSSYVDDFNTWV